MILPSVTADLTKAVAIGATRAAVSSPLVQALASVMVMGPMSSSALMTTMQPQHAARVLGSTITTTPAAVTATTTATTTLSTTTSAATAVAAITTATTSSNNYNLLYSLSGGAQTKSAAAIDLTRFRLRLDGLHTYSVITTLLLNGALRLFTSTSKKWEDGQRVRNAMKLCFSVASILSVLAGSYTTIVFSLLGLYAKRALGRGLDEACLEFFHQARPIREVAYDACLVSLVSFQVAFCLSVYLNHDGKYGLNWKLGLGAGVLAFACWWHWSTIYYLAHIILQLGSDM